MSHLFVVSDVHGYLADLVHGLRDVGLVDASATWCGGDAALWVLGDLTDRGPDGIGVVDLLRDLQAQAPGQVHVLMGNHEALALGAKLFPGTRFQEVWTINGGRRSDQDALTSEHIEWLRALPVMGRVGDFVFMHSDTTAYFSWGESIEQINGCVRTLLAGEDFESHWQVFSRLSSRYHFARADGSDIAAEMLDRLDGECIVHGHSIIGSLTDRPSSETTGPLSYAGGLALAIDGGRYDGGPLLVVRLH